MNRQPGELLLSQALQMFNGAQGGHDICDTLGLFRIFNVRFHCSAISSRWEGSWPSSFSLQSDSFTLGTDRAHLHYFTGMEVCHGGISAKTAKAQHFRPIRLMVCLVVSLQ
jgi:hypothetical protein